MRKMIFMLAFLAVGVAAGAQETDSITDASLLNNYVMAGSYIRPFTVDFMLTYKF